MQCPFCGGSDLREKINQFVCNGCGKNTHRGHYASENGVPKYIAVKFRMGGNRALAHRAGDELGPGEHLYVHVKGLE